jgi:hypothetical protein
MVKSRLRILPMRHRRADPTRYGGVGNRVVGSRVVGSRVVGSRVVGVSSAWRDCEDIQVTHGVCLATIHTVPAYLDLV